VEGTASYATWAGSWAAPRRKKEGGKQAGGRKGWAEPESGEGEK